MRSKNFHLSIFLILTILAVVINLGIVSAAVCSDPSQVILRLSSATNAHGEVYNGAGGYSEEICYNTIFGATGNGNRACTGINKVVRLSSDTNAHAENPSGTTSGYIDVCYGNLTCTARSGGACAPGEFLVLSISSATNAHLANDSSYPEDICCSVGGVTGAVCGNSVVEPPETCDDGNTISGDGCSNICALENCGDGIVDTGEQCDDGNTISGDGCSNICAFEVCALTSASWSVAQTRAGNQVSLNVQGTNCNDGLPLSFDVFEDDLIGDTPATTDPANVAFANNVATGTWTAEWIDDGLLAGNPEYYFIATLVSIPTTTIKSGNPGAIELLTVTPENLGFCQQNNIVTCESYTSLGSAECESDQCAVADDSAPNGVDCDTPGSCICRWDETNNDCDFARPTSGGICGDGIIQASNNEQCDGGLDGKTCSTFELSGTGLVCNAPGTPSECQFDTSGCTGGTPGICGDGNRNPGETCDGTNFSLLVNSCDDIDEFDVTGTLGCGAPGTADGCQIDTTQCTGGPGDVSVGVCVYDETVTGSCAEGDEFIQVSYTPQWIFEEACQSDPTCVAANQAKKTACEIPPPPKTLECPAQIPLPFFGFYNFVVALVAIVLVYWVLNLRGRKK